MINDAEVQNAVVLLLYIVTFKQKGLKSFLWFLCAVLDFQLFFVLDKRIHTYRQRRLCSRENTKKREDGRRWSGNHKNDLSSF